MAHEDKVTLNGQDYWITGPVSGRAVSEFSAGFKVGRATYDDREHAFFLVLDDFSGGIGFRRIDEHEALGGIWDNNGGVDVRRAKHVTLPPLRGTLTAGSTANTITFTSNRYNMVLSDISGAEYMYVAAGDKIFRMDSARAALTEVFSMTASAPTRVGDINSLIEVRDPDTLNRRLYAFSINGSLGGANGSRYWYSTNGTVWTEAARVVYEAIAWEAGLNGGPMLVASMPNASGTVCGFSTDGINWNIDNADANVNRPKWKFFGLPHWIGVAMAPWGAPTPYFLDNGRLYALDFYKENAVLIEEVGDKTRLTAGGVYEGQLYVTDGYNIWAYDPGAQATVRRVGIYNRFGVPPSLRGFTVSTFVGGTSTLYAVLDDNANSKMRLMAYTGIGWTPLGPVVTSRNPLSAIVDRFPIGQSLSTPSRFIDVLTNDAELNTTIRIESWKLPTSSDVPTVGDGFFDAGPDYFETGWMDGGFLDISGALHRMSIDAFSLTTTETVKVEYRVDNNESAAYTTLGTFNNTTTTLWFDSVNHRGVQFRTVQFKITLVRGATTTVTPELIALTLVYDKKPEFRSAWTFRIDVNRMVEKQTLVGGSAATPLNIWQALKTAYDVKTLLPFIIPNVEPAPGINVRIVDMPLTYDDFRDAVDGKGYVDISVLQPLAG